MTVFSTGSGGGGGTPNAGYWKKTGSYWTHFEKEPPTLITKKLRYAQFEGVDITEREDGDYILRLDKWNSTTQIILTPAKLAALNMVIGGILTSPGDPADGGGA